MHSSDEEINEEEKYIENYSLIKELLNYLIQNLGVINISKIETNIERILAKKGKTISEVFYCLLKKYKVSNKTREEKVKFILRKAFKYMKDEILLHENFVSNKDIDKKFFKIYFQNFELEKNKSDIKDFLMPFRKNSVNKTMNQQFLNKIFGYKKFSSDFLAFLSNSFLKKLQIILKKLKILF